MDSWDHPFDAAAKLDIKALAKPDVTNAAGRVHAILPDWMPCYTRTPDNDSPGEDTLARALVMIRGTGCQLSPQCFRLARSPSPPAWREIDYRHSSRVGERKRFQREQSATSSTST